MAHISQINFCKRVKGKFPESFKNKKVFDGGSLDINGNNRIFFEDDCDYIGCDIGPGKNVDVVCPIHKYECNDEEFDTVISTECFEHDRHYVESLKNLVRMLKSGGLFLFTCATTGRREHGTRRSDGNFANPLSKDHGDWADYYLNVTEEMVRDAIDVDEIFESYEFSGNASPADLYFWGIKK